MSANKTASINGHFFSIQTDGLAIRIVCPNGNTCVFSSSTNLGRILDIRPHKKKLLITREFGFETFQTALDPSRFRLEVVHRQNRRLFSLRQIRYILGRKKK